MKTIVGVRFRKPGKVYFFDPGYIQLKPKDKVIELKLLWERT